ncbi:MAG: hypothetical protein OWU33_01730 [Firmicutes bacterium]|nr:hypothetical protein [Bacillota bacterium]
MELSTVLAVMGFLPHGKPKGYRMECERLTLWIHGGSAAAQEDDLWAAVESVLRHNPTAAVMEIVRQEKPGGIVAVLEGRWAPPTVGIIGNTPDWMAEEAQRWRQRGYAIQMNGQKDLGVGPAFIVREGASGREIVGRAPALPLDDSVGAPWH